MLLASMSRLSMRAFIPLAAETRSWSIATILASMNAIGAPFC